MPTVVKLDEINSTALGKYQAEMLGELVVNLQKKGVSDELIERIAISISGAASSWLDGCKGMENPADLVSISSRVLRTK